MGPPPYPRGRVSTRFAIAASGRVESSCIADSTVKNPRIDRCIVDAILKWEFPRPIGGGWVLVEYPFRLIPGDDNTDMPPRDSD
jgi:outer membrane biosynthesis protein TonB